MGADGCMWSGSLVHPCDGHPLGLRRQAVDCLHDLVEGVVEVVVDNYQVEVLVVGALHFGTLLHRPLEVVLLEVPRPRHVRFTFCLS